jgi:hypothetical protein
MGSQDAYNSDTESSPPRDEAPAELWGQVVEAMNTLAAQLKRCPGITVSTKAISPDDLGQARQRFTRMRDQVVDARAGAADALKQLNPKSWQALWPALGPLADEIDALERQVARARQITLAPGPARPVKVSGIAAPSAAPVDIRNSQGVVIGDDAAVTVIHHCDIEQPRIELAELLDANSEWLIFRWLTHTTTPGQVHQVATTATEFGIRKTDGVLIGDHNTLKIDATHTVRGCRLSAPALLSDPDVRASLIAYRDLRDRHTDSPEPGYDLGAATQDHALTALNQSVSRAANSLSPTRVAPDWTDRISTPAPQIHHGHHQVIIRHAIGAAIGDNAKAISHVRQQINDAQLTT